LRTAFGIHMPVWQDVGVAFLLAAGVMMSMEITKLVLRRRFSAVQGR
jgi:hypothetical protein